MRWGRSSAGSRGPLGRAPIRVAVMAPATPRAIASRRSAGSPVTHPNASINAPQLTLMVKNGSVVARATANAVPDGTRSKKRTSNR